ncbi:uncharacterized protein Tco025E_06602 [Trypanosoma conorhini]|uniref:FHA domain-containing protein n=1 Tax=Trypanosoma conorhini TaxID=83891 RepID=A0A3R7LCR9_9TRYP|nr:uncharacterized protein Tco025E_06602 [Trypanosoma conorhini]RNF11789.1 hypothetical protein Tco025E_06602 [Trypanosoma conorhini]
MEGMQRGAESLVPLVGDCELALQHATSYEPPMYLFPELLPKVPEGTAPFSVSDAVSDAVDVEASSLNIAELFHLPPMEPREETGGSQAGDADVAKAATPLASPAPMTTLAALLAADRLQVAGLSAEMLQRGKFSSGSIIEELMKLKDRAQLNDIEAQAIMSNHFINVLAWRTLIEVNNQAMTAGKREPTPEWRRGRVRPREEATEEVDIGAMQPSDDPWSADIDLQPGVFVSAAEQNVEQRIELIDTLTALYRRPWQTLQSRGIQTERFTPGSINETAPFVDPVKLPAAMLDPVNDLGWKPSTVEEAPTNFWELRLTSSSTAASEVIPLRGRFLHFGRNAGVTSAAHGTVTNVHIGLSAYTNHPEFISPHHFSLAVFPANPKRVAGEAGAAVKHELDGNGETGEEGQSLWLMNYGRNGVRIAGKQWTLGDMVRLEVGDVLQPTDDIRLVVLGGGGCGGAVGEASPAEATPAAKPEVLLEEYIGAATERAAAQIATSARSSPSSLEA